MEWTADGLVALSGIALSLIFAYLPWVKDWFESLDSKVKPLMNLGVLVVIVIARLLIVCKADWDCIQVQLPIALVAFGAAMITNQTTYQVVVRQFKK